MLDQNTSIPLYEQMKISIRRDIERKKYAPGDRMPSEAELEEQYRVSRITVRRAIKELCDENVLIKRQGKGTFVIGEENNAARLDQETLGFHESIRRNGKSARSEVIKKEIIKVKKEYAGDLEIDPDDDVIFLQRVMYADKKPIMIDNSYIPLKRFPGIFEKLTEDFSLIEILEKDYGVKPKKYYRVLKVRKANEEMSRLLNCQLGDPVFDLFKLTFDTRDNAQYISISLLNGADTYYVMSNDAGNEIKHSGLRWKV